MNESTKEEASDLQKILEEELKHARIYPQPRLKYYELRKL